MLLHTQKYICNKNIFSFLYLTLLFLLSYILKVLSLCKKNKHLNDNIFTFLSQLLICFHLKLFL